MNEEPRLECGWTGPLPAVGVPQRCAACLRLRTFGDVKHKRCIGRVDGDRPTQPTGHLSSRESSGIGDRLEAAFGRIVGKQGCGGCQDLKAELNGQDATTVLARTELVEKIFNNVDRLTGPVGLVIKGLAVMAPQFCRGRIRSAIEQACQTATPKAAAEVPAPPPSRSSFHSDNAPA